MMRGNTRGAEEGSMKSIRNGFAVLAAGFSLIAPTLIAQTPIEPQTTVWRFDNIDSADGINVVKTPYGCLWFDRCLRNEGRRDQRKARREHCKTVANAFHRSFLGASCVPAHHAHINSR